MELSARNQLAGTIARIELGDLMAEVTVDIGGGQTVVSLITRGSVERLRLKEGDQVVAVVKATEVLIGETLARHTNDRGETNCLESMRRRENSVGKT